MGRPLPQDERDARDAAIVEMRQTHRVKEVAKHFRVSPETVQRATRRANGDPYPATDWTAMTAASEARASSEALLAALQAHHVCPKKREPEELTSLPLRLSGSHHGMSLTGSPAAMCPEMKGL